MTEETVIIETTKVNIIQGSINGISKENFDKLQAKTRQYFHRTWWDNDVMYINNSQGKPYLGTYDEIEMLFNRIAQSIVEGKYGKLGFIGLVGKREIIGVVFFGYKQWELQEFKRPEAPEWYKTEDWHLREKWREELEWDELFKRK
jgi:hypothetical protein